MAATGLIVFFAVRMHYEAKIKHLQAVVGLQNEQIASAPAAPQNPFAPQVGPRHLSALQKKFLTRVLSHAPKPAVVYVSSAPDDAETADYAKDLLGTISGAGWTTRAGIANLEPPMPAPFLKLPGLILFVNDRDKAPGAKVLQQAM